MTLVRWTTWLFLSFNIKIINSEGTITADEVKKQAVKHSI
ncbi:unnamed protein product [Musa textilis]